MNRVVEEVEGTQISILKQIDASTAGTRRVCNSCRWE